MILYHDYYASPTQVALLATRPVADENRQSSLVEEISIAPNLGEGDDEASEADHSNTTFTQGGTQVNFSMFSSEFVYGYCAHCTMV